MQLPPANSPNVPPYYRELNSKRGPSFFPHLVPSSFKRKKFLGVKVTNLKLKKIIKYQHGQGTAY
jgi:hypothetical protein